MKNLIMLTFLFISFNLSANNKYTYYKVEGRSSHISTAKQLVSDINPTNHVVHARDNDSLGEYFIVSYFENNKLVEYTKVHLSDVILAKYLRHRANAQTGEQILEVCGTQASQILSILRLGLKTTQPIVIEKPVIVQKQDSCNSCKKLDDLKTGQDIIMDNQQKMYEMQLCSSQANLEIQQLITRYNTAGVLEFYGNNRANRELEQLKQKYPCIPADMTIHRANKLLRDGLDILNVGLNTYTAIKVSQKPQVRYVNNRVIDNNGQTAPTNTGGNVDHNPNGGNVGGHNNNGNRTALVTNRGGAPIGYTYQQRLAMRNN